MITALVSAFIMSKADVWFGDGAKMRGQIFGSIAIAFPALVASWETYALDWLFIPILLWSILCFLTYRQWGVWGELFPNKNKDVFEPSSPFKFLSRIYFLKRYSNVTINSNLYFVKLVNRLTGMVYAMRKDHDLIRWKRIAWGVRFAVYGAPITVMYALCGLTLAPFVLIPVAGLIYGTVYEYGLNETKGLLWCHKVGGFIAMLIMGLSL